MKYIPILNRLLVCWLCFAILPWNHGSAQGYRFSHISNLDGLPQGSVADIMQDHQNYMWFTTLNGVCRYNGTELRVFKHDPSDSNSLKSNEVRCVTELSDSTVWIGTKRGLSVFDPKLDALVPIVAIDSRTDSLLHTEVHCVFEDAQRVVWVGTQSGLLRYHLATGQFLPLGAPDSPDRKFRKHVVRSIYVEPNGVTWISSSKALYAWNGKSWSIPFDARFVYDIMASEGRVYAFTHTTSVLELSLDNHTPVAIPRIIAPDLSPTWVSAVTTDHQGRQWYGSYNGLYIHDHGHWSHIKNDPGHPWSLPGNNVMTLYCDRSGTVWVGTNGFGLSYYNPKASRFTLFSGQGEGNKRLSHEFVNGFYFDESSQELLVGTYNGLNAIDPNTQEIVRAPYASEGFPAVSKEIKAIHKDRNNRLWVGTNQSLEYMDLTTREHRMVDERLIKAFLEDTRGRLLAGSDDGVYQITEEGSKRIFPDGDLTKKQFHNRTNDLIEDSLHNSIWVGTVIGVVRLDQDLQFVERYRHQPEQTESLPADQVKCLYLSSSGDLWVGTWGGGLARWRGEGNDFETFSVADGLPNDVVYGILEDEKGCLWLSTNNGISCFDPATRKFTNFDVRHGLQSNEFNTGAYASNQAGVFFFGGPKGLNIFKPSQFNPDTVPEKSSVQAVLTSLEINRQLMTPGPDSPIARAIDRLHELTLSHDQNTLRLNFATPEFIFPRSVRYRYQLENFDTDWNEAGMLGSATYTNLPPGDYTFRIRHSTLNGPWIDREAVLHIHVLPPWWSTIWFALVCILASLGLLIGLYKSLNHTWARQRIKLESKVKERTLMIEDKNREIDRVNQELIDLNNNLEEKVLERTERLTKANHELDSFVYSVSHDIRAPLTSIQGLVNLMQLESELDKNDLKMYLERVQSSVERLDLFTQDVLRYARNSRMELRIEPVDFEELIRQAIDDFSYVPEAQFLDFRLHIQQDVTFYSDRSRLIIILLNLVSNAVRYRNSSNPVIEITLQSTEEEAHLTVRDNGIGIRKEYQEKIFDMFFRADTRSSGSGLGLYILKEAVNRLKGKINFSSIWGEGSEFTVQLPNLKPEGSQPIDSAPTSEQPLEKRSSVTT